MFRCKYPDTCSYLKSKLSKYCVEACSQPPVAEPAVSLLPQVILACLAAVALAAPQEPRQVEILRDERTDDGNGHFSYLFETEDGVFQDVKGYPADNGGQAIEGEFR